MDLKKTETEENYVRRLATGLCMVWNHNPAVFSRRWIKLLLPCNKSNTGLRTASICGRVSSRQIARSK